MGLSTSDIKTALQTWLQNATGLDGSKVIWAFQNAPEPTDQFINVNPILSIQTIGRDEQIIQTNGDIVTRSRRAIMVQIDVYGDNAMEQASNAFDAIYFPLTSASFTALCLSLDRNSGIRNLSALKDGLYENRASFDVKVSAVYDNLTLADDIGWFDSIEYSGTGDLSGLIPVTIVN